MKVSINIKIWTGRQDTLHGLYTKRAIIYRWRFACNGTVVRFLKIAYRKFIF